MREFLSGMAVYLLAGALFAGWVHSSRDEREKQNAHLGLHLIALATWPLLFLYCIGCSLAPKVKP